MDKPARLGWRIENLGKAQPVQVLLFGTVGDAWEGVTGADFVNDWRAETKGNPPVVMTVNSIGGYIDDALGIYNEILQYPGETTANIIVAKSAAGFISMAAKNRAIAKTGEFQMHDAMMRMFDIINSVRLDEIHAQWKPILEAQSEMIAGIFADRAGGNAADWRKKMQANGLLGTSWRGQDAVTAGLVHEVMAVRNQEQVEQRIAAFALEVPAKPIDTPSAPVIDFAAAIRAARLESPTPTLQQLLETQSSLSTALKGA
jgi:ATP-dependent protease ClpP protease subunit